MKLNQKIYVAGHNGLVGSALIRQLNQQGYTNIITKTSTELDLTNQDLVNKFFQIERPEYVFLAAAKVGGINANNSYPADFIYKNLAIQTNVIHAAYKNNVSKFCFLGSSCIYPKHAKQPMKEQYLLDGLLEPTNEAYAIAKIAGIKMCQAYRKQYGFDAISLMPTNLYGINDNFDLLSSHVLPAMIKRFHDAKENNFDTVTIWGTGSPKREFLFSDDMADAAIHLMNVYSDTEIVNVGVGEDISILELAQLVAKTVDYQGKIITDSKMPDGTPRKLLDVKKINSLGWTAKTSLTNGLNTTYNWFKEFYDK